MIHGYDNDTRELEAIPEVREWFAKLFEVWPYWSFFASRVDQTVPLVLTLLLNGEVVVGEPGMVGWSFDLDEGVSPNAIDVCSLALETRRGVWVAQPQIKPKGISKKKRTIGVVEFRYFTEVGGRFMHLLPKKEDDEPLTILH